MTMVYDDDVHINGDERGDFVFSWPRDHGRKPVRVQASKQFVTDHWKLAWSDRKAVKDAFRARRGMYLKTADQAPDTAIAFRIFAIGE